ncbi:hypothetical protein [Allobaculum stercoricanis]|uniref:hypothetical protein n=1 Tax=Allobaculum stercoricanis TaxID=174709 RepID=UPI002943F305|nr:hypothetical protein [Allobaculum stercoricanis]
MGRKKMATIDKEWQQQAESYGLLDQKHFRQALEAYNFQIELAEILRKRIGREGTSIVIPVGKDGEKLASNPAIADLNKAEILAQKIRMELDGKMNAAMEDERIQKEKEAELNERL